MIRSLRERPPSRAPRRRRRCRSPAIGGALLLPLVGAFLPPAGEASEAALIPREDNHWDAGLRRAVDLVRRGELSRGIQVLQDIAEDPSARRLLRGVPADFGPATLLAAPRAADPLGEGAPEAVGEAAEAPRAGRDPRGEVRIAEPPEKAAQLYLPVAEVARQLLAGLSPEGVAAYRKIYDPVARERFDEALASRRSDLLRRVAEDFAPSSVGIAARDRLAEGLFEEGRFWTALDLWRSILAERAEPEVSPSEVELKSLSALRLLGEEEEYAEARKGFLSHMRSQAGSDGLAGAYETLLAWLSAFEADHPFPPGTGSASIAPGMDAGPLPRLPGTRLGLDWVSTFWSNGTGPAAPGRILRSERTFPFFPRISPGEREDSVFVSGVFRLQRISALTGRVSRIYAKPVPGRDLLHFEERSDSPVYCVSLGSPAGAGVEPRSPGAEAGDREAGAASVIITGYISDRVKSQSFRGYEIYSEIPTRSLAAIDAATARVLWQTGDLAIGPSGKVVSFTTPALVHGRRVFACGWQQVGYINSVIASFDLVTGKLLWHQLLASNQLELTMFGEMGREPFAAVLAEREGVLYCMTNLGAVAALEADTGDILWLTTYPTIEVESGDGQRSPIRDILWGVNPPLFLGETLIVTPRDSEHLLGIEIGLAGGPARSRRQPGRILFSHCDREMRDLLGHVGGVLYFTGPGGVQALDIREAGRGGAPRRLPTTIAWTEKGVEGRGALTDSGVVVAAETPGWMEGVDGAEGAARRESRLCLVDLSLKKRVALTGALSRAAPGGAGLPRPALDAGNVTVGGGRALLTSRDSIASFSPREPVEAAPRGPARRGAAPAGAAKKGGSVPGKTVQKREDL